MFDISVFIKLFGNPFIANPTVGADAIAQISYNSYTPLRRATINDFMGKCVTRHCKRYHRHRFVLRNAVRVHGYTPLRKTKTNSVNVSEANHV